MYLLTTLFSIVATVCMSQEIVTDYPRLPQLWRAETIEPGAPGGGKGVESYLFNDKPSSDTPSALWSNYTDCQRLIYVPSTNNAKRYLLGCDAVNCCWEPQSGNQVEFQIPNVQYSNPSKSVVVYHQKANVTNFGEIVYADEWSWSWKVKDVLSQDWRAYTVECDDCVGGVQLIQWQSRAMESAWFAVEFKNYKGYDASSEEGIEFVKSFEVPAICQKNNLLECPSGLHDKYFGQSSKGVVDLQGESECAVASYLKKAGFPSSSIGTMICIAKYESSFNCKATNKNTDGSTDYGLFEINSYYWCSGDATSKYNECGTSCQSLMDCQKNANCAYRVYKEQGYSAWYGYQYHKSECDSYPTPICLEGEDSEDIYKAVSNVDLTQYSGRWYQVYKDDFDMLFQGQGTCAVADYTLVNDKIEVLNSQVNKNGKVGQIKGVAFYEGNNSGGELSVSLDGVPKTSPYWIIELGPIVNNQYVYSIVSDPKRTSLFVLTRDVDLFYTKYDSKVRDLLNELGFNNKINKPTTMIQEDCDYTLYNLLTNDEKCCEKCEDGKEKYYSVPILSNDHCGESCINPDEDWKFHLLEPALKKADSNTPCLDRGFNYIETQTHSAGPIKIDVDIYMKPKKVDNLKGPSCGTCGTGYQTCCIGFAIDGYPCDCHLTEGGSGTAGSNCGDCGTAFAACCIGYAADGYPCECDVM